MKPVDPKSNTYINVSKEINDKNPKFKVSDHLRTSKYENVFGKGCTLNWSEEVFVIKYYKNTVPLTYINGKEIVRTFDQNELQKTNQKKKIRIEQVIKRKRDKLYIN